VSTTLLWYTTRATGVVAQVLLTATVMLGVVGTARAASARWPRIVTAGLHRNLALTSTVFVGLHVLTTVLDPFASISLVAAFVPFSSDYRPLWLSLGAVASDLLLAVLITSLLRDRLNHRLWHAVHLLVYVCWPVALWHGLGTGTDTRLPWILGIDLACVAGVAWAIWWRLRLTENPTTRAAGVLALALVPLLTAVFVLFGPLQPGWSRRAGTPAALLGSAPSPSTTPGAGGQPAPLVDARFTGHLKVRSNTKANLRTITMTGRTVAVPSKPLLIVLRGTPSGRGVSLVSGTASIGRPGSAARWAGPVIRLTGPDLIASLSGTTGRWRAEFVLHIRGSVVTGAVTLRAADGG
jgi:Ferric reductase like transmembrane component